MRRPIGLVTLACAALLALAVGCTPPASETGAFETAFVTRVVDGDTIHARLGSGETEKVRLIGVDTPEDTSEIEVWGAEATEYTRTALEAHTVYLQTDVELRDVHGRLLAYVWLDEPTDPDDDRQIRAICFNAHLLLDGYAQLLTVPPNTRYVNRFRTYQTEARDGGRGLWGLPELEGIVFWGDAGDHVGEIVTIEGPVAGTYRDENDPHAPTFINIGRDHPDPQRLTVFIPGADHAAWEVEPEPLYGGRVIRVTGQVERYEDHLEIVVTSPDAIEVLGD